MKRLFFIFFSTIISTVSFFNLSFCDTIVWDYTYDNNPDVVISNDNKIPNTSNWYKLNMPDTFTYDSSLVTSFTISMYGMADNSTSTIDMWTKLGTEANKIVGYDVYPNNTSNTNMKYGSFILTMDLMDQSLDYTYEYKQKINRSWSDWKWATLTDVASFSKDLNISNFDELNSFLIGYACSFKLDKTSLHIEQNKPVVDTPVPNPVPEPGTILLLGIGTACLLGLRKIF